MSIVSKFTVTPLLYACGILLAAVLGLSGALVVQNARHEAALAKVEGQKTKVAADLSSAQHDLSVLEASNRDRATTIEDLAGRLSTAVGEKQQVEAINRTVIAERDTARRHRDRALAALQRERSVTYANEPTCADWAARPVCGAITSSVLDHWDRTRSPDDGQDAGGGGSQAPAGADRPDPDVREPAGPGPDPGTTPGAGVQPALGVLLQPAAGADADYGAGLGFTSR